MESAVGREQDVEAAVLPALMERVTERPSDQLGAARGIGLGLLISGGLWVLLLQWLF